MPNLDEPSKHSACVLIPQKKPYLNQHREKMGVRNPLFPQMLAQSRATPVLILPRAPNVLPADHPLSHGSSRTVFPYFLAPAKFWRKTACPTHKESYFYFCLKVKNTYFRLKEWLI